MVVDMSRCLHTTPATGVQAAGHDDVAERLDDNTGVELEVGPSGVLPLIVEVDHQLARLAASSRSPRQRAS
jgi:hypothetical protein